ncbi:MAG TPA: enolase C-terminal domain-like protein [Gaiellaceae bacterium]|jgi:L-alanine-DL-glutamate epimerase-like enolase superfamily enzyme|nr:enolase C-terminal domain-like protein [Gaiellaceae bacterium]
MIESGIGLVAGAPIEEILACAYTIPTDGHESDGTLEWDATTIVVVEIEAAGETGIGWTYGPAAVAHLIDELLAPAVSGSGAYEIGGAHLAMRHALRNAGVAGTGSMAISAVDVALWDLKARLLGVSVAALLPQAHREVPIYGSGGFCSYPIGRLVEQLEEWVESGIPRVKMKVGRDPDSDVLRVLAARRAIGDAADLYVDANGAFTTKQALRFADDYAELGVSWFEEPVSSLDVDGLCLLRDRAPAGMDIAAGEYAATLGDFVELAKCVDCLQADVTRCGGITGLLAAASIAEANELDLSGHTAPTIHAHALCAVPKLRHLEWFHDHVRIEQMLFDGFLEPTGGVVKPDLSRPGLGVEFKRADARRYAD